MQRVIALVRMGRFTILPGGLLAYTLGTAMGYAKTGTIDWAGAAAALGVMVSANLMAHYADEYADVDTDSLARRTWFSGGSGVLPSGIVPPVWSLRLAVFFAAVSIVLCAVFIADGLLPVPAAWILGVGLLGGWFYSMPPVALERRGLGELDNALLGGIFMPLLGYTAQTGAPSSTAVLALLPVFLIVLADLLGVHWSDRRADAAVGKRSLVVIVGDRTRMLHRTLIVLAYGLGTMLAGSVLPWTVFVALLVVLPVNAWAASSFGRHDSPVPTSLGMAATLAAVAVGWIVAA